MTYFMKLNLPKNPLVDPVAVSSTLIDGGYNLVNPRDVLNDEIMDIFSDLKLKPKFVSLFGSRMNRRASNIDSRMIHTDIQLQQDLTWKKLLFGINWEIGDAENIFSWWDMNNLTEIYPSPDNPELSSKHKLLSGIHYGQRFKTGIPDNAIKLDETMMNFDTGPTLVRTNIPHITLYKSRFMNRVGVSVRFDESDFGTWEDVTAFMEKIKN